MKATSLVVSIAMALMLAACSDSEHEINENRPISNVPSTPSSAMESMVGKEESAMDKPTESVVATVEEATEKAEETMEKADAMVADTDGASVMEKAEEMAEESGVMDEAKEMMADTEGADLMEKAEEMAEESGVMDEAKEMMADAEGTDLMEKAEEMAKDSGVMDKAAELIGGTELTDQAEEVIEEATDAAGDAGLAAVSMEDGTALAKKSGCFACHAIDRKILGPAWKDVAARYADDQAAGKAHLLNKVAKGGSGVWADQGITAGMPPYSPRVSDENIEILVDFILGL